MLSKLAYNIICYIIWWERKTFLSSVCKDRGITMEHCELVSYFKHCLWSSLVTTARKVYPCEISRMISRQNWWGTFSFCINPQLPNGNLESSIIQYYSYRGSNGLTELNLSMWLSHWCFIYIYIYIYIYIKRYIYIYKTGACANSRNIGTTALGANKKSGPLLSFMTIAISIPNRVISLY